MNTIQLNLLETKQIAAYVNGYSYALEGGYRIVAGEQGATEFQITSVPQQYSGAKFTIQLINAHKQLVKEVLEVPLNGKFTLPVGMAVAGYGQMLIWCDITHSSPTYEINVEKVIWTPLKLKIWNTSPDWKSNTITLTDEILDRLNQAEDDVRALEELVKNIEINPQGGGTTMLTEGREFGKELKDNDYFLDVIDSANTITYSSTSRIAIAKPVLEESVFEEIALSPPQDTEKEISLSGLQEEQIELTYPQEEIELTSVSDASGVSLTYQDEIN